MKKLVAVAVAGLFAIVGAAALVAPALGTDSRDLLRVRLATERFQSVDQAQAEGYVIDSPCVFDPAGAGGMGVHYMNHALANDPAIDMTKPEILVYEPRPSGDLRLVAVEYFRRAADQNPLDGLDQSDKPTLFGRAFDGIMPAHAPHHGWHYDLHLWLYKRNPSGMLNPWNPAVFCP